MAGGLSARKGHRHDRSNTAAARPPRAKQGYPDRTPADAGRGYLQARLTLFFVSFFGIAMMNSVGIMQAYLFNEILKIPPERAGLTDRQPDGAAGDSSSCCWSAWPARCRTASAGRRSSPPGSCCWPSAIACTRWPAATWRRQLGTGHLPPVHRLGRLLRQRHAVSVANDYPIERSRAKMIAAVFIFNGVGIASPAAADRRPAQPLHRDGHRPRLGRPVRLLVRDRHSA